MASASAHGASLKRIFSPLAGSGMISVFRAMVSQIARDRGACMGRCECRVQRSGAGMSGRETGPGPGPGRIPRAL